MSEASALTPFDPSSARGSGPRRTSCKEFRTGTYLSLSRVGSTEIRHDLIDVPAFRALARRSTASCRTQLVSNAPVSTSNTASLYVEPIGGRRCVMRISVTCPFCDKKGTLPEAMRGQRIKCAGCHQPFVVALPKSETQPSRDHWRQCRRKTAGPTTSDHCGGRRRAESRNRAFELDVASRSTSASGSVPFAVSF